jgi:hypothetical protein
MNRLKDRENMVTRQRSVEEETLGTSKGKKEKRSISGKEKTLNNQLLSQIESHRQR